VAEKSARLHRAITLFSCEEGAKRITANIFLKELGATRCNLCAARSSLARDWLIITSKSAVTKMGLKIPTT
jgi:hypothetical protein